METKISAKTMIIATVVAFVILFGFGGLWHMAIFKSYYYNNPETKVAGRADALMLYLAAGNILMAFAISWFYLMAFRTGSTMMNGILFGLMVGVANFGLWGLIVYGALMVPDSWISMEGGFSLIQGILCGTALWLVTAKKTQEVATA